MNPLEELIRRDVMAFLPIADALDIVEMLVAKHVSLDEAGNVTVAYANLDGSPATIADVVADVKRTKPALFQDTSAPVVPDFITAARIAGTSQPNAFPATGNLTERAIAYNAYAKSPEGKAARAKEIALEATADGKPFAKGASFNLTRQMMLSKADPALAARLKAEAR